MLTPLLGKIGKLNALNMFSIEKIDFKAKRNENVSSIKEVKTQNH